MPLTFGVATGTLGPPAARLPSAMMAVIVASTPTMVKVGGCSWRYWAGCRSDLEGIDGALDSHGPKQRHTQMNDTDLDRHRCSMSGQIDATTLLACVTVDGDGWP